MQSSNLYTRGGHLANGPLHERNAQSKYSSTHEESIKQMRITILVDHKDHKLEISQNKNPIRIDIEMIAQHL